MKIKEIKAKGILSKSKIFDYAVNPYVGCSHGCNYCYARFIRRFTGNMEPWGEFVNVKINASELLYMEIKKKKKGEVWVSGISDPYQPIEKRYRLTRRCLEILVRYGWPVTIQTKSNLVLLDLDLLEVSSNIQVFLTITTGNDKIRKIFEPYAPSVEERINTLRILYSEGIKTHVMIAPLLPGADELVDKLGRKVSSVLIDKMNYHYADWVYRKHGIEWAKEETFFRRKGEELKRLLEKEGIPCELLF